MGEFGYDLVLFGDFLGDFRVVFGLISKDLSEFIEDLGKFGDNFRWQ